MVQMFEAHAGVGGAELPVDALLGRVAGLRPRGDLRVDGFLRGHARGQGLPRQDAQFRFGPVEPAAVPGVNTSCTRWTRHSASAVGKARKKEA